MINRDFGRISIGAAFVWLALYGACQLLSAVLPAAPLGYALALALWLRRKGMALGLRLPGNMGAAQAAGLCCLLALPACNLLLGWPPQRAALGECLILLGAAATEEIVFRGVLLRALGRLGALRAAWLSSAAFALAHAANGLSGIPLGFALWQMACALAAGLAFGGAALAYGSLLPAMAAHALINLTGAMQGAPKGMAIHAPAYLLCMAVYAVYGVGLCRKYQKTTN